MKPLFTTVLISLIFSFTALAQKPLNSGELISKASGLHRQNKYKEAIQLYRQVPRNDTNYVLSLYQTVLSLTADSSYQEALEVCNKALKLDADEYEPDLMLMKGSILDEQDSSEKAVRVYDAALAKYPNSEGVKLNKSIALLRLGRLDEAEEVLKQLLIQDPFYGNAHFKLAQCALLKGLPVQAAMGLFASLINNPEGSYSTSAIQLLSAISNSTDDITKYVHNRSSAAPASFAVVEKIVLSKIALDKNYKVLTSFDDPIIRQLQVMFEKLEYVEDEDDFWMQYYTPTFKKLLENKLFEPSIFYAFSNTNIEKIQQYNKRNKKALNEAIDMYASDMSAIRGTRMLTYTKRQNAPILFHFDDGVLFGKGTADNDKTVGNWEFYYPNGNVKGTGNFDAMGEKNGRWTFYYPTGQLSGYEDWKNGKQHGEDVTYNKQGVLIAKSIFADGKLNGEKLTYFSIGHLFSSQLYKNGLANGKYVEYYGSGRKKTEATLLDDKLQGAYTTFYQNGLAEIKCTYDNAKLTGAYKSYYENGQTEFSGTYAAGVLEGETISYHSNGQIQQKTFYKNALPEGEQIEYNDNGIVTMKLHYVNGKAEGTAEYFDDDGKLYSTFAFKNDRLETAHYFDKSGKQISTSERKNKMVDLTTFSPEGFKASKIMYNDNGLKEGNAVYYYPSGKIKETNTYVNGELDGVVTGYFANGTKEYEVNYKEGKKNGLYTSYYINGTIKEQGWYQDDQLTADWINYNAKGGIETRSTYSNNDLTGFRESFYANGRLDYEDSFRNGWLQSISVYDTTQKVLSTSTLINGTGDYKGVYANGKVRFDGKYLNGFLHGRFNNYYFDGSPFVVKYFNHGLLDSLYTEYHFGGKISATGKYKLGKKEGVWKYYLADGSLYKQEQFKDDNLDGTIVHYLPSGKIERETQYKDGVRNGWFERYAEDGQLSGILYFKNNVITGYSYNDRSGKELPLLSLPGGKGNVLTYYANGNKSSEAKYVDGEIVGAFRLYHPNGKLYYETNEIYGNTNGRLAEYYSNGTLKSEYNYYYDNQDGPYKEYYENGNLKEEGNFFNGYPVGTRTYYDINGKQIEQRKYYFGTLINATK
jgi:antitoxin component YwqK of YwqJK toxin-antitoxin module